MILGTLYLVFKDQATVNLKDSVMVCQYTESSFIGPPTRERIIAVGGALWQVFSQKINHEDENVREPPHNPPLQAPLTLATTPL
jgi:hypothetical protein